MSTIPSPPYGTFQPISEFNDIPDKDGNESANTPTYPHNHVTSTESGHSFELDDTPTRERIRLQHRCGTFIEMHSDGTETHKIIGDGYEIVANNKHVVVSGICNITINGDCNVTVHGNKNEFIAGDLNQVVGGKYTQVVKGDSWITSEKDMTIGAAPNQGSGVLYISTSDHLYLSGDLHIDGQMTAKMITSETRVDALVGVSAGPAGFTSALGGVTVGVPIPVAIPGMVIASQSVNAGVSVTAPLGTFHTMNATFLMRDLMNKMIYNCHIHPTPKGPSGTPKQKMI